MTALPVDVQRRRDAEKGRSLAGLRLAARQHLQGARVIQTRYLQSSIRNRLGFPRDLVPSPELMVLMCPFSNGDRKLPRLAIEGSQQPEDVPEIAVGTFIETPQEPDTRLHRDNFAFP